MELEGTVLEGKYRLVRCIGEGGMGNVYEAEHVELGKRVAVKVLRPEHAHSAESVSRFRREAAVAATIAHDNVCEVLDVGATRAGERYLVMPLLRGTSLAQVIATRAPFPIDRALDIAAQVLAALAAAHDKGVIHRDLKPENVFITRVAERDDFVKVLDFGISKVVADDQHLTRPGLVLGTPEYLAPERLRMRKDQDHRVDVYSAGAVLYEMLTGRRPWEGTSTDDTLEKIMRQPLVSPRSIRREIPPEVERIVLRGMARDPGDRTPNAATMRAEVLAARRALLESTDGATRPLVSAAARAPAIDGTPPDLSIASQTTARVRLSLARWVLAFAILTLLFAAIGIVWMRRSSRQPVIATPIADTSARLPPLAAPAVPAPAPRVVPLPPLPDDAMPEEPDLPPSAAASSGPRRTAPGRNVVRGPGGAKILTENR